MNDTASFLAALGDVPSDSDPELVRRKSRDMTGNFSPVMKDDALSHLADVIVRPRDKDDVLRLASAAALARAHDLVISDTTIGHACATAIRQTSGGGGGGSPAALKTRLGSSFFTTPLHPATAPAHRPVPSHAHASYFQLLSFKSLHPTHTTHLDETW